MTEQNGLTQNTDYNRIKYQLIHRGICKIGFPFLCVSIHSERNEETGVKGNKAIGQYDDKFMWLKSLTPKATVLN